MMKFLIPALIGAGVGVVTPFALNLLLANVTFAPSTLNLLGQATTIVVGILAAFGVVLFA